LNDFQRIKAETDLYQIIQTTTGLKIKGHHLEECPFCGGHDCFSINQEEGYFKCFQCDTGGDIFTFLERYHSLNPQEALKKAARLTRIPLNNKKREGKLSRPEKLLQEATLYYHRNCLENGGKDYFIRKRKHSEDTIKKMKVGFADGRLCKHLLKKGFTKEEIIKSGLGIERDGELRDFFSAGLALFPHFRKGNVIHFTMKDPRKEKKYQLPASNRSSDWLSYNQEAFDRYSEIIIVEGEHDCLSLMDAGLQNVIALIGQPSKEQIRALKGLSRGKTIILWLDNDKAGQNHARKIYRSLEEVECEVRIIPYNEEGIKDPDEFMRRLELKTREKVLRERIKEALSPVDWEIRLLAEIEGIEERRNALRERGVFKALSEMGESDRLVYIEKIKALGFSEVAIREEVDLNRDLFEDINLYLSMLNNKRDADPNTIAKKIFRYFNRLGRFFTDMDGNVFLLYDNFIYILGNNRPFNALIKKATGLLPTKEPGRSVWESLASEGYLYGKKIELSSWLQADRVKGAIYVNLNSPGNKIIKISVQGVAEIPNGLNDDGVLLRSAKKIRPVTFMPDADIREGFRLLKDLIFANLACEHEQRYLVLCWILTTFLLDFAPYMALMKFSGPSSSGKTTAAKLLSLLIYGNEHLGHISTAAAYASSSVNPLVIFDNLESGDIGKSLNNFLLLSTTKGGKEKRTTGTNSETTEEHPKALVLITAIEPFTKPELINRTFDIEFHSRFKREDFIEDNVITRILQNRDLILSSVLKFLGKAILPNLNEREKLITILKMEYRNHAKNRTDEFLSLMMLILNKVINLIPYYDKDHALYGVETGEKEIRKRWIEYQNQKANETDLLSNDILKLLDGLINEYLSKMKDLTKQDHLEARSHPDYPGEEVFVYKHPEYLLEVVKTAPLEYEENGEKFRLSKIEFVATAGDIVRALDRYCKNMGIRNPYPSSAVFVSRLNNEKDILKKGGWEIVSREATRPYFKKAKGANFWKLKKEFLTNLIF